MGGLLLEFNYINILIVPMKLTIIVNYFVLSHLSTIKLLIKRLAEIEIKIRYLTGSYNKHLY